MSKTVIVPWSGGLDSTALVMLNLEAGNIVRAPYIEITNNFTKVIMEQKAIQALLKTPYMKSKVEAKQLIQSSNIKFGTYNGYNSLHLSQFPVWIIGCLFEISSTVDEVQFGYVMNDDAVSYLPDMMAVWESYRPFVHNLPELSFPFSKWKKSSIVEYVNNISPNIYNLTWSCEDPIKGKPCKKCPPCLRRTDVSNIKVDLK